MNLVMKVMYNYYSKSPKVYDIGEDLLKAAGRSLKIKRPDASIHMKNFVENQIIPFLNKYMVKDKQVEVVSMSRKKQKDCSG